MDKIKYAIIALLGVATLIYQSVNSNFFPLFRQMENAALLRGQLPIVTSDSYFGVWFDYLIAFLFNVNIKDAGTYFIMFGGK